MQIFYKMTQEDYIKKYGEKEGTRRWKGNERNKQWRQEHRKERIEYHKEYNLARREEQLIYWKERYQAHREEKLKYHKQYEKTPYGRALNLITTYRHNDRLCNRGECTLTAQWIVDNIFSRSCLYCGESDWRKLGTDRIDNSRPHTPNNVVCSCGKCNKQRSKKSFYSFKILHSADFLKII